LVTQGKSETPEISRAQDMTVSSIDLKGNVIWEKTLAVVGAFADAVKSDKNNQSNLGILLISTDGAVVIEKPLVSRESMSAYKVIKIDSENLNILGIKDNYIQVNNLTNSTKPLLYMLISPLGEVKYTN